MFVVQHNMLWRIRKSEWKNFLNYAKVLNSVPPLTGFASKVVQEDVPVLSDDIEDIDDELIIFDEPDNNKNYKRSKLRELQEREV